jgi:hypothetical protein
MVNEIALQFLKDLIFFTVLFLISTLIHELGHIIHHKYVLKKWPAFGITKYLFFYVVIDGEMTLGQRMINILIAIFVGLVFVISIGNFLLCAAYIVACMFDVKVFIELWKLSDRYGYHRTMIEVIECDKDR